MKQITHNTLRYYQFETLRAVKHGIFTRHGGTSQPPWDSLNTGGTQGDDVAAVRHNHQLMYDALNVDGARACTVWMVHGADTVIVNGPVRGRRWVALADAMVTDQPDTPLVMRYADCTPIMAYDPVQGVIGTAHAGWRGTVQGAASSMARTMIQAYGCNPQDIRAGIGPAIGPDRYQVGEEVVDAIHTAYGDIDGLIRRDPDDGTAYLDLWEANRRDLHRAGIKQIEIAAICTAQRTDEFYSHRAEKGRTGRFGTVIAL